jgi:hypothetical protein
LLLKHDAEIEPVRRLARIFARGMRKEPNGLLKRSSSVSDEPKEMIRLRMMRIDGDDLLVESLSFDKSPGTMVHNRFVKKGLQGYGRTTLIPPSQLLGASSVSSIHDSPDVGCD